jgi:hypothetical protein
MDNPCEPVPRWLKTIMFALTLLLFGLVARSAIGEQGSEQQTCGQTVWHAAQTLQPWFYNANTIEGQERRSAHLVDLTRAVCISSRAFDIDPLLSLAVARRESSLLPRVGRGEQNGARGERGYFQVMPDGAAERFRPTECSQHEPKCNAMTAMGFMADLRDNVCQSADPWVWLGAYGRGRCPSPDEARTWSELHLARRFLCEVTEDCASIWPE